MWPSTSSKFEYVRQLKHHTGNTRISQCHEIQIINDAHPTLITSLGNIMSGRVINEIPGWDFWHIEFLTDNGGRLGSPSPNLLTGDVRLYKAPVQQTPKVAVPIKIPISLTRGM